MKRWRRFLQLSRRDQLLLIYATVMVGAVTLGLRLLPWSTLQRQLIRLANWSSQSGSTQRPSAQHIAWTVRVASSIIPKATCLPRALAAQFLLIQNAYPVELKIGVVRNEDGHLGAHAWVASNNRILIGSVKDLDHFVPLSAMERQGIEDYGEAA